MLGIGPHSSSIYFIGAAVANALRRIPQRFAQLMPLQVMQIANSDAVLTILLI